MGLDQTIVEGIQAFMDLIVPVQHQAYWATEDPQARISRLDLVDSVSFG